MICPDHNKLPGRRRFMAEHEVLYHMQCNGHAFDISFQMCSIRRSPPARGHYILPIGPSVFPDAATPEFVPPGKPFGILPSRESPTNETGDVERSRRVRSFPFSLRIVRIHSSIHRHPLIFPAAKPQLEWRFPRKTVSFLPVLPHKS